MLLTDEPSLQPLFCLWSPRVTALGSTGKDCWVFCSQRGLRKNTLGRDAPGASRAESWLLTFDLLSVFFFPALDFVMEQAL